MLGGFTPQSLPVRLTTYQTKRWVGRWVEGGCCSRGYAGQWPLAERGGFEPPIPCGTLDFESSTINHSATSPKSRQGRDGAHFTSKT